MNIRAISESIRELLAEQNHDVTNITIRSMMNRIIALNSIVIQFVDEANKDDALSTELGVTNNEVLQLHQFSECIAILDDTDFNTNLYDWHSPNSVDKYYCQNLNGRNANAKSQIHS